MAERMGARLNQALEYRRGAEVADRRWATLAEARARWPAYDALVSSLDDPLTRKRPRTLEPARWPWPKATSPAR